MGNGKKIMVLCAALAVGRTASAAEVTATQAATPPRTSPPKVGLMLDAGLPDGIEGSLLFRPRRWVRAHVGGGYNLISPGVRAGLTLIPFGSGPSATVEAGHYFEGDANGIVRKITGSSSDSAVLQRVGYDYANFHLGLELGYWRMTFYLHGGMSYVRGRVHHLDTLLADTGGGSSGDVVVKEDPVIHAWAPSAKLGVIVYLW